MSREAPLLVVLDAATLVQAQAYSSPTFRSWPHPPAMSSNPSADALAVPLRWEQWGLAISEPLLRDTAATLLQVWRLPPSVVVDYVATLREIAERSGGGVYAVSAASPFGRGVPMWMHEVARLILTVEADAAVLARAARPPEIGAWQGCWVAEPASFAASAHTIAA